MHSITDDVCVGVSDKCVFVEMKRNY